MKCVAIASGGMDSVTMLYKLIADGYRPYVLSFDYKQKHSKELQKAEAICAHLGLEWQKVDLSDVNKLMKESALSDNVEVPKGHYAEETMKATFVPSRNTIMLAIASAYAVSIGAADVFFGAHAGDHAQYPDCREDYVEQLNKTLAIANFTPVKAHAPFLKMDKGDIATLGIKLGVPYEDTWTCYEGKEEPCGECGACVERTEAFLKAGQPDPLVSHEKWNTFVDTYRRYKQDYNAKQSA